MVQDSVTIYFVRRLVGHALVQLANSRSSASRWAVNFLGLLFRSDSRFRRYRRNAAHDQFRLP